MTDWMEPIRRSQLWEVGEQFGAINQVRGKSFGRTRIIGCDVTDNVFETRDRGGRENYFVSRWPTISRTRAAGTPRPLSSSPAALSNAVSNAVSSCSDIRVSSCERSHAARADFSFGGSFVMASWISVMLLTRRLYHRMCAVRQMNSQRSGPARTKQSFEDNGVPKCNLGTRSRMIGSEEARIHGSRDDSGDGR